MVYLYGVLFFIKDKDNFIQNSLSYGHWLPGYKEPGNQQP